MSALIGAAINVFTSFPNTNAYVDACMNALLKSGTGVPECFIRIDRSHFVKSIIRNTEKGDHRKNKLIRGVLGFLIQCTDHSAFKKIIQQLFVLIRNEYFTFTALQARDSLVKLVRTHQLEDLNENEEDNDSHYELEEYQELASLKPCKMLKETIGYAWITEILNQVELSEMTDDAIENIYYTPEYENYLITTIARAPLWSNLMMEKFHSKHTYATSSAAESEFKNIKSLLKFNTKRTDVFLKQHIEVLSGMFKLASAEIHKNKNDSTAFKDGSVKSDCNPHEADEWIKEEKKIYST